MISIARILGAPDTVPAEIHEHHVLGTLFRIGLHLLLDRQVLRLRRASWMGARDRTLLDAIGLDTYEHLGRRADDRRLAQAEEEEVGRWVDRTQRAVDRERIGLQAAVQTSRQHDLIGVAGGDVLLGATDGVTE